MNNDKYIVIKSLPQPDGGEGASEWQGASGNGRSEESHSENAGRCTKTQLGEPESGRVCNTRRSPLSIAWRRSVDWALAHGKSVGLPREILEVPRLSRVIKPQGATNVLGEVSRGRTSCRSTEALADSEANNNETGVAADGFPVQRMNCRITPAKVRTVPEPNGSGK